MKYFAGLGRVITGAGIAALLSAAAVPAAAGDGVVYWSFGAQSFGSQAPSLHIAAGSLPPPLTFSPPPGYAQHPEHIHVYPAPVYGGPAPVYVRPAPVYVRPAPVYVLPAPVYAPPHVHYSPPHVHYSPPPHGVYGPPARVIHLHPPGRGSSGHPGSHPGRWSRH